MAYLIGAILALAVGVSARLVGLDRDRAFYPTVMIVIASYYALFAVMAGSLRVLAMECAIIGLFLLAALAGFRATLWVVVAALLGHGLLDAVHGSIMANPGVPAWWPPFCGAYDVVAGLYLAWLLSSGRLLARSR